MNQKPNSAYSKYLISLLLFGSNGIVSSHILLASNEIVFFRTLIGSVFLFLLFFLSKGKLTPPADKKHFVYLILSGAAMGGCWLLLFEAYVRIGVGISTLAYYCGPVIVMALSPFVFHEKISAAKVCGLVIVLSGMFLINSNSLLTGGLSIGLLCAALSAVFYAAMVILSKKASSITGLENSMYQLAASFLTVAVFTLAKQGLHFDPLAGNRLPILVLGIVNTGVGCYLYFSSIQKLPVGTVSICGYLEPLSAVIFSVVLLGESLTLLQAAGGALIIGGAVFAESAGRRKRQGSGPSGNRLQQKSANLEA